MHTVTKTNHRSQYSSRVPDKEGGRYLGGGGAEEATLGVDGTLLICRAAITRGSPVLGGALEGGESLGSSGVGECDGAGLFDAKILCENE